jgi:hypothetical protein
MPVRITLQPEKPSDSPKVQAFGIAPTSGIENPFTAAINEENQEVAYRLIEFAKDFLKRSSARRA